MFNENSLKNNNLYTIEEKKGYFFSGFVQADGCFHVNMQKDSKAKHKIRLKPTFYATQLNAPYKQISPVLRLGRDLLQTGHYVVDRRNNCSSLCINTLKDLNTSVLPHFERYPLMSRKKQDYLVFKEIVESMSRKLHLDEKGFSLLVEKAVQMNGSGKYRKKHTARNPRISAVPCFGKPNKEGQKLHPPFVSGLFQGDGSFGFSFRTRKDKNNKKTAKISPFFTLGQECLSVDLLHCVKDFFKSGKVYKVSSNFSRWMVTDSLVLKDSVLPHFAENPLVGVKENDFLIFKECLDIFLSVKFCKKERAKKIVELCYNLNMEGKRRRLPKEEYLRTIAS